MAAEAGHMPSRVYNDQAGDFHLNGAQLWDAAEAAIAQKITFTPAAGTTNVSNVTVQVQDGAGNNLARVFELCVYLSDDAGGNGLSAHAASGGVAAGTAGTVLQTKVTGKAVDVITDNTGKFILAITDTSKTAYVVAAFAPGTGNIQVSAALATGNYG